MALCTTGLRSYDSSLLLHARVRPMYLFSGVFFPLDKPPVGLGFAQLCTHCTWWPMSRTLVRGTPSPVLAVHCGDRDVLGARLPASSPGCSCADQGLSGGSVDHCRPRRWWVAALPAGSALHLARRVARFPRDSEARALLCADGAHMNSSRLGFALLLSMAARAARVQRGEQLLGSARRRATLASRLATGSRAAARARCQHQTALVPARTRAGRCINQAACDQTSSCLMGSGAAPAAAAPAARQPRGGGARHCADLANLELERSCAVDECVITQSACARTFVCDNGTASFSGTVTASNVHFEGVSGKCDGTITGGTMAALASPGRSLPVRRDKQ